MEACRGDQATASDRSAQGNSAAEIRPSRRRAKLDSGRFHGAIPMRTSTFSDAQIVAILR
jgi:hypothetical protein